MEIGGAVEGSVYLAAGTLTVRGRVGRGLYGAGRAIGLDPMGGRDRRIIHIELRNAPGVARMSIGEGRYRQVGVVPEGAPEYEEAVRESRLAAGDSGDGEA